MFSLSRERELGSDVNFCHAAISHGNSNILNLQLLEVAH